MTDKEIKQYIKDNFDYLASLPVKEYTLYRKWIDIQMNYPIEESNDFFDNENNYPELQEIRIIFGLLIKLMII